jgi:flagellar motor switch protein FliM
MSDTIAKDPVVPAPAAPDIAPPRPIERGAAGITGTGMRALVADDATGQPRLPMLLSVVERLAGMLTISFCKICRGAAIARAEEPKPIRFGEFAEGVHAPALIAVLRLGAWNGACLAVIDNGLADTAIGLLLGGGGNATATAGRRDYTAIERTLLERLARDLIATNLARSFEQLTEVNVTLDRLASDPADAAIARPRAQCLTWRIAVTLDGQESTISFLLPYAAIEPIRPLLARDRSGSGQFGADGGGDPAWQSHLRTELPLIGMKVKAILERRRATAGEVLQWKVGSTLVLNHRRDEPLEVFCDDLLVLRARMAEQDGRIALHVDEKRLAEDWERRLAEFRDRRLAGDMARDGPGRGPVQ